MGLFMKANVKITVLEKSFNKDFIEKYMDLNDQKPCEIFDEGQEFISKNVEMPSGFCSWAWADIQKYVMALSRGAKFVGVKPGLFVTCCTDGFRPVIFKLERLES